MTPKTLKAIELVNSLNDPEKLRSMAKNAHRLGDRDVFIAAKRRLFEILPAEEPGTLEHDVWRSINALEDALGDERGKTIRLARTRQKIQRSDEVSTVRDLVLKEASDGFRMLLEREMLDLSFEAVALRHPDRFSDQVLEAARIRLEEVGYTP